MGRIRHLTKSRVDALCRYYKNPGVCKNCNKTIKVGLDQTVQDAKVKKFCSHSCSSTYNNSRRPRKKYYCSKCNNEMWKTAKLCRRCMIKSTIDIMAKTFLFQYSKHKYNEVRRQARKYMNYLNIEKKCLVCGFDICVDVAHIKKITDFNSASLIGEVNNRNNLVYLCPNHHAMLDRGLLDISKFINGEE